MKMQCVSTPRTFTLGVVGAGLMGGGIAQVAAQAGIRTLLFDAQPDAAANAREQSIGATLNKLVSKGKITEVRMLLRALEHLKPADSLEAFRRLSRR